MRYAIYAWFVLLSCPLYGQLQLFSVIQIPEKVHTDFRVTHSMGEPCIQQQFISKYLVTEGFQQGDVQAIKSNITLEKPGLMTITPNPASDLIYIHWRHPAAPEADIIVSRSDGIIVKKQRMATTNTTFFIGDLISGTYIIQAFDLDGNMIVRHSFVKI